MILLWEWISALSGFFCVRFICAYLSDPRVFNPEFEMSLDNLAYNMNVTKTLFPFSSLLMTLFSLSPMAETYEPFNVWNKELENSIFQDLVPFVLSIGEIENEPEYEPPSNDRLKELLMLIAKQIHTNDSVFVTATKDAVNKEKPPFPSWAFCEFLNRYFAENVPCDE